MDDSPAARLKKLREDAGLRSAKEAAEQHEWNVITYSAHEAGGRGIRLHVAQKYARAFGTSPAYILTGQSGTDRPEVAEVYSVPLKGTIEAGAFRAEEEEFEEAPRIPAVPSAPCPIDKQYALLVKGNSMNKLVPAGDYVIVCPIECTRAPRHGDVVVVKQVRGDLVETTLKRFHVQSPPVLMPESTDPKHQEAVEYDAEEGSHLQIVGIAAGRFGVSGF